METWLAFQGTSSQEKRAWWLPTCPVSSQLRAQQRGLQPWTTQPPPTLTIDYKGKPPDVPRQWIEMALLGLQSLHRPFKGKEWVESGRRNIINAAQLRLVPWSWASELYTSEEILSPFPLPDPISTKKCISIDICLCSSIYSFLNIHLVTILYLVKYQAWDKQSIDMLCPKDLTIWKAAIFNQCAIKNA